MTLYSCYRNIHITWDQLFFSYIWPEPEKSKLYASRPFVKTIITFYLEHDDSVLVVVVVFRRVRLAGRAVLVDQKRVITIQRRVWALPAAVLASALRQSERHALVTRAPLWAVYLAVKKHRAFNIVVPRQQTNYLDKDQNKFVWIYRDYNKYEKKIVYLNKIIDKNSDKQSNEIFFFFFG